MLKGRQPNRPLLKPLKSNQQPFNFKASQEQLPNQGDLTNIQLTDENLDHESKNNINEQTFDRYNNEFRLYDSFDKENSGSAALMVDSPHHNSKEEFKFGAINDNANSQEIYSAPVTTNVKEQEHINLDINNLT